MRIILNHLSVILQSRPDKNADSRRVTHPKEHTGLLTHTCIRLLRISYRYDYPSKYDVVAVGTVGIVGMLQITCIFWYILVPVAAYWYSIVSGAHRKSKY